MESHEVPDCCSPWSKVDGYNQQWMSHYDGDYIYMMVTIIATYYRYYDGDCKLRDLANN